MNKLHILFCTAALGAATAASAQTGAPADAPRGGRPGPHGHGGPGPGRGGHPVIRVLDVDHDGTISAAELANAAAGIRSLDTNGDGVVSAGELHPARPARPTDGSAPARPTPPADAPARPARPTPPADGHQPVDPVMLALDANGDGALTANEIAGAPASLAALDLNKDGKLTLDELRPLPPAR